MFNFFASLILALAICATLGSQLATTAYRNTQITHCADCQVPAHALSRTARADLEHRVES
jgi:hypothetical protein